MKSDAQQLTMLNTTKATVVCERVSMADTFRTRLFGLLGRNGLPAGTGLLIEPSSGVHTFAMSFPIDIIALDRKNTVVGAWDSVGPWRICGLARRTRRVLELPSGQIARTLVSVGDQLVLTKAASL